MGGSGYRLGCSVGRSSSGRRLLALEAGGRCSPDHRSSAVNSPARPETIGLLHQTGDHARIPQGLRPRARAPSQSASSGFRCSRRRNPSHCTSKAGQQQGRGDHRRAARVRSPARPAIVGARAGERDQRDGTAHDPRRSRGQALRKLSLRRPKQGGDENDYDDSRTKPKNPAAWSAPAGQGGLPRAMPGEKTRSAWVNDEFKPPPHGSADRGSDIRASGINAAVRTSGMCYHQEVSRSSTAGS